MDIILPEKKDVILPRIENVDEVIALIKQVITEKTGFELTDAVCPLVDEVELKVGFQRAVYIDELLGRIQMVIISQTKDLLFDLFTDLMEELFHIKIIKNAGIDAMFESRHIPDRVSTGRKYDASGKSKYYRDYMARRIDPVTFLSMLYDFEELLMNDGFTGVSILSEIALSELRFDSHKSIVFFSKRLDLVERITSALLKMGIPQTAEVITVGENPHIHFGHSNFNDRFRQLVTLAGAKRVA